MSLASGIFSFYDLSNINRTTTWRFHSYLHSWSWLTANTESVTRHICGTFHGNARESSRIVPFSCIYSSNKRQRWSSHNIAVKWAHPHKIHIHQCSRDVEHIYRDKLLRQQPNIGRIEVCMYVPLCMCVYMCACSSVYTVCVPSVYGVGTALQHGITLYGHKIYGSHRTECIWESVLM